MCHNQHSLSAGACIFLACWLSAPALGWAAQDTDASHMQSQNAFRQIQPGLFVWTDTCNVYVLKDGDAALLVDLGDGSVLEHLKDIGVARVEWVLFTHHHREQCQGAQRLKGSLTKLAAPQLTDGFSYPVKPV